MARFRVLCLDKMTGRETLVIITAATRDDAAKAAMDAGSMVGRIEELAEPVAEVVADAASVAPDGGEATLTERPRRRGRVRPGIESFFSFQSLIVPSLVRGTFLLLTVGAALGTLAVVVAYVIDATKAHNAGLAPPSPLQPLLTIAVVCLSWVFYRVIAEFLTVLFNIHDRLIEIESNTAR